MLSDKSGADFPGEKNEAMVKFVVEAWDRGFLLLLILLLELP